MIKLKSIVQAIMKNVKMREKAGISLLLASIIIGLLLVNLIVLAGGKNMLLISQVGTKMEQEAERALSMYNSKLYKHYGLWGMPETVDTFLVDHADVKRSIKDIEGVKGITFSGSEGLWEPFAMKTQIDAFMKARFPVVLATQTLDLLKQLKRGVHSQDINLMQSSILKSENSKAIGEFSSYLENVKDLEPSSESDTKASFNELTLEVLSALKKEMQSGLASSIDLETSTDVRQVDAESIFTLLNDAQAFMEFETNASYQKLALNEYALHMFPTQIHTSSLSSSYPITHSLRGFSLLNNEDKKLSLEHLITGKPVKEAEKSVKDSIWLMRFLCNVSSILGNNEKMSLYRKTANILSLAVVVASAGKIQLPPEALTYSIVTFIGMKEAGEDVQNLLKGEAVLFLPYTEKLRIKTHYHDYLRILLLTLPEEGVLERICSSLKEHFGENHYTTVSVELDWQSPYFSKMQEKFATRRSYVVYQEDENK